MEKENFRCCLLHNQTASNSLVEGFLPPGLWFWESSFSVCYQGISPRTACFLCNRQHCVQALLPGQTTWPSPGTQGIADCILTASQTLQSNSLLFPLPSGRRVSSLDIHPATAGLPLRSEIVPRSKDWLLWAWERGRLLCVCLCVCVSPMLTACQGTDNHAIRPFFSGSPALWHLRPRTSSIQSK